MKKLLVLTVIIVAIGVMLFVYFNRTDTTISATECINRGGKIVSEFDSPIYKEFIAKINTQHADICVK